MDIYAVLTITLKQTALTFRQFQMISTYCALYLDYVA